MTETEGLRPGALLLSSAIKGQRGKVSQIPWAPVVKDILIYIDTALGIWGRILPILGGGTGFARTTALLSGLSPLGHGAAERPYSSLLPSTLG